MGDPTSAPGCADLGVYVHVPFCERVCPYCDFAVEAVGELAPERARGYVELLLRELELARGTHGPALEGRRLASVYLGGGTPSLLPGGEVERLLAALARVFGSLPGDVTLELNPGQLEVGRLADFARAGVTRLSVGVQSLHDAILKRLGRAQSAAEARRGLDACLAAGFRSVSADLIQAAPDQSEGELFADLDALIDAGVPHLSVYALTIEPGTPFAARARGRLRLPDEDLAFAMSQGVRARLAAAGYGQYEISSFARPGHRSRHNQRYWSRRDVLGLGVSAAGLLGDLRIRNHRTASAWSAALERGRLPLAEQERLSSREARRETLGLGLRRLDGVSRAAYWRRFESRPEDDFATELRELRSLDLIADRAGFLRLTERGILFADEVFLRFVGTVDTPSAARLA